MRSTADAVVIGGGVHGCSVAYHLAACGMRNVVLLEKDYLAAGGTGRSAAGIRRNTRSSAWTRKEPGTSSRRRPAA